MSGRFFRDVTGVLKLPCERHTELFSQRLDQPLRRGQRVGLWLHLRVCEGCRRFKAQLEAIAALQARERAMAPVNAAGMPPDVRARIADSITRDS